MAVTIIVVRTEYIAEKIIKQRCNGDKRQYRMSGRGMKINTAHGYLLIR